MPEIRLDPLTETSVIIAANRDDRPYEFEKTVPRRVGTRCPFCQGNEDETPVELVRYPVGRSNGTAPWSVRVVPNKYPAVRVDNGAAAQPATPRKSLPAFGRHEVIIESPQHKTCFGQLTSQEARLACVAYRDRLRVASDTPGIKFAHVFKNMGPAAGASLEHVHAQLIALPIVPTRAARRIENERRLGADRSATVTAWQDCAVESDKRIVERTDNLVAHCPYAARFPFEVRIAPVESASGFLAADLDLIHEFSDLLQRTVRRVELVTGRAAYNYSLNVPPFDACDSQQIWWQLELFPRLSTAAGFELATGWFINPMAPEVSARILRDAPLCKTVAMREENSTGTIS